MGEVLENIGLREFFYNKLNEGNHGKTNIIAEWASIGLTRTLSLTIMAILSLYIWNKYIYNGGMFSQFIIKKKETKVKKIS